MLPKESQKTDFEQKSGLEKEESGIISIQDKAGEEMINFNKSKTRKTMAAIIIFVLEMCHGMTLCFQKAITALK